MIKELDNETYTRFLKANNATRKQVAISDKGKHYGYYVNDKLIGVISKNETKNTIRIKGLLVNEFHSNNGYATKLLNHLLDDTKDMTAFSTNHSRKLFENADFKVENTSDNDIAFMRRTATSKRPEKKLDPSIIADLNPHLVEISKTILLLEDEERKLARKYITDKLKELR